MHLINNANHQQKHEIFGMNHKIIIIIIQYLWDWEAKHVDEIMSFTMMFFHP